MFLGKTSKNSPLAYVYVGKNPKHKHTPDLACSTIYVHYVGDNEEKVEKNIKVWLGVKIIRVTHFRRLTFFWAAADGGERAVSTPKQGEPAKISGRKTSS